MKGDGSALGGTIGKFKTMEGQVSMAAIVGGTASKLGGGKFANGAVSGAFVHMYNYTAHLPKWMPESGNRAEQEYTLLKVMNSVSRFFLYAGDVIGEAVVGGYNGAGQAIPNAHPAAQLSLSVATTIVEYGHSYKPVIKKPKNSVATTIVEYGLIGPIAIGLQVPYDLYSGSHFVTIPTSPAGWIGYGLSGTAE